MSSAKRLNVPQLVKSYREKYPTVDRDLLRKLIRLENKIENPSELKKLDRHLGKAFKNTEPTPEILSSKREEYIRELKQIGQLSLISADTAWHLLGVFQATLPSPLKERVSDVTVSVGENESYNDRLALKIAISKISSLIYAEK